MLDTIFVVFRECIEIAIMLSAIYKVFSSRDNFFASFYRGIVAGSFASVSIFSFLFFIFSFFPLFTLVSLEIFQFLTLFISFMMMFWAVVTMRINGKEDDNLNNESVFYVSFITMFREITETLLFVITFHFNNNLTLYQSFESVLLGLVPGLIIGLLSYLSVIRLEHPYILSILHFFLVLVTADIFQKFVEMVYYFFDISYLNYVIFDLQSLLNLIENTEFVLYKVLSFCSVVILVYLYRLKFLD